MLSRAGLEPDVLELELAGMEASRRDDEPDHEPMERNRDGGLDRCPGDLARRRIHPGGDVHRHDGEARGVDLLDLPRRLRTRLVAKARPEERVDDDVAPGRHVLARLHDLRAEQPGRDAAVAAVRALPAHRHDAGARIVPGHGGRDRTAGPAHQLGHGCRIARIPLLRGAHLLRGVERLKHRAASAGEPMVPP